MIRAIITDLDGTILPKGGSISPQTEKAFQKAGMRNCIRIIATGRNLYSALKVLPDDFPVDYLVFSSGAGILRWCDRQILFARHLKQQETRDIASYLWDFNINFTIQREIPDNHYFYYTDIYPLHEDYKQRLKTYEPFGTLICSPEDIRNQATQFVMILDTTQLRLLQKIRKDLAPYSVVRSTSPIDNQAIWLEIFAPGINKGVICQRLLGQYGIKGQECAGLGNDYNDADFLNFCGEAYVVSNAPLQLKRHYKTVASDKGNGFSEFIEKVM